MNRQKEKTAHIRKCIKREGISARVRMSPAGQCIQIITPTYEARFTSDELRTIATIAKINGLTKTQRNEIDVDLEAELTGANQVTFEYHADLDREAALIMRETA